LIRCCQSPKGSLPNLWFPLVWRVMPVRWATW